MLQGRLLSLPTNIILVCTGWQETNALAYSASTYKVLLQMKPVRQRQRRRLVRHRPPGPAAAAAELAAEPEMGRAGSFQAHRAG